MESKYWVLVALVRKGPASAVVLEERLREWGGLLSSTTVLIDRSLIELCAEGFVEGTGELRGDPTAPGRRREVFVATAAGEQELDRWLADEPDMTTEVEADLESRVAWLGPMESPEDLEGLIVRAREREAQARADLGDRRAVWGKEIDRSQPGFERSTVLVRNSEVMRLEAEIDFMVYLQAFAQEELSKLRDGLPASEPH